MEYIEPKIEEFVDGFQFEWNWSTINSGVMDMCTGEFVQMYESHKCWENITFHDKLNDLEKFNAERISYDLNIIKESLSEGRIRKKL